MFSEKVMFSVQNSLTFVDIVVLKKTFGILMTAAYSSSLLLWVSNSFSNSSSASSLSPPSVFSS